MVWPLNRGLPPMTDEAYDALVEAIMMAGAPYRICACGRAMRHNGSQDWPRWVCRCGRVEEDR